jgi:DNA (cytosine-5)-methyltransferase 1
MFKIEADKKNGYTFLGLFAGAGGLDLGFELAGFEHTESNEILDYAVETLQTNRPNWNVIQGDVRDYTPHFRKNLDVLLAGFPCQGFSLGGNRNPEDERNTLYKEVVRIADVMRPRIIIMENVLNLRTMAHPENNKPFAVQIAEELASIGYKTIFDFFRVSNFGVPQTRRRFIFVAFRDFIPKGFMFPKSSKETPIKDFLYDLAQNDNLKLPNHNPQWGFDSSVHTETQEPFESSEIAIPVRLSRTASEGNPIRSFDEPFPAIDTATVWGWAQGNVVAKRIDKDRRNGQFIRNPNSTAKLWRIQASKIRQFSAREYARVQTFPDDWVFKGKNKRELQLQIGNAVPVMFAFTIAKHIRDTLLAIDNKSHIKIKEGTQLGLFA